MTTKLKYGSLFSGVGGFDLGFDQENYECVFQVEWDKHCQKILAKHWPEVPKWSDVQDVNGAEIPPCDVLTFGSPCQDLSVAGKRAGLEGTKSSMFYEATRIIKEMRNATESVYPRIVVWENVPGALSSNNGADFGAVLDTLADIGAVDIQWSVLDAQYFRSTPQRRRRIFVVAIFDPATSDRCPNPLLPVAEGSRGDFAKGRKARQGSARSAEASIDTGGQWWNGDDTAECLTGTSNEQRMPDKNRLQAVIVPNDLAQITYKPTGFADYGEGIGTLRTTEMGASASHLVTTQPTYSFDTQFGSNAAVFENQSPTLKATQQSPSVTLPGLAIRRLTPLECERLMGWPDDHTRFNADGTEQADTHRYRQCGNGVATPVARFIAKHLKKILITNDDE